MRRRGAQTRWLVVAGLALAALTACSGSDTPVKDPSPGATQQLGPDEFARELFELTNEERVDAGVAKLEWSDCVAAAAAPRAEVAATTQKLEHEVLVASCHQGAMAGENLSRLDGSPRQVVDAWMASEGHHANLVREDFVISGIACAPVEASAMYACSQLFEGAEQG